jgi:two-component system, NtrC family, sensor histidine kinase HydH
MLPLMARRIPPLAAAIVLVAAGLLASAWSTQRATTEAYEAVRDGQAFAIQQAVRADLADLGGPPGGEQLAGIISEHASEGLVYLAMFDGRGRVQAAAGTPLVERPGRADRSGIRVEHVGGRVRLEVRATFRRAWGPGNGALWIAMEVEPVQARELRSVSRRTVALGALGALVLLGVAAWLVRAELRRRAREQERERERRLASLGEMSAVLAHEIRNPLASLKGNAQLLAASLPEGEKQRAKAERVVDEAVRLEKLTQDLLAFVRTGELARAEVVPAQLVREVAAGFDNVTCEDDQSPAAWSLDASRMREVLVNLIENAIAAGPPVRVRVSGRGGLTIEVADHGPGVKPDERDKIFEPFFTGKTRGTGLGLAIAKRVVELHGGTIRVDDAPGGGALFRIEIPHGAHPGR